MKQVVVLQVSSPLSKCVALSTKLLSASRNVCRRLVWRNSAAVRPTRRHCSAVDVSSFRCQRPGICRVRSSLLARRVVHEIQRSVLVARAVRVLVCWCASSRLWSCDCMLSADYVVSATLPSAVLCRHHNKHLRELPREVVTDEREV